MSVGPMGMASSVAGSHLAQVQGSDLEKSQQEARNQARQTDSQQHAQEASGVGEAEQDEEASDRDADGRRLWEAPPETAQEAALEGKDSAETVRSKDPTGQRGGQLDVSV